MSYRKKIALILLFIIGGLQAVAQNMNENGNYNLRTVIAPSANTASLGKFGEIPVSPYTGIPNISIPLYDIKDKGLSVPVGISYHAGGVRVEEIASSVGIGWALNAGGMIGRQVRGQADEIKGWVNPNINGRISTMLQSSDYYTRNSTSIALENGDRDGEPDIYYYNFNGKSGKFLFDEAGNIHGYPVSGVKILPATSGWTITTEDGTVYLFDKSETTDTDDQGGPVTTAWYLSRITSADGASEITFLYDPIDYTNTLFYGETKYFLTASTAGSGLNDIESKSRTQWTHTQRLTRINFSDGYVRLNYNNPRLDINNNMDKSLDQIEIYNIKNQLIKKFDFTYSYFGGGGGLYLDNRLKLMSITEKSLTQSHPPYIFTYNEAVQSLSRNTLSKDHWGYYNGKPNGSLIPQFHAYDFGGSYGEYNANGADRNTDTIKAKAFMLQKITYPTGGETEFAFESNTSADPRLDFTSYTTTSYGFSRNELYSTVPSPYEEPEFTIPASGAQVKFTITGLESSALGCDIFQALILKDGEIWAGPFVDSYNFNLTMPAGTYKLKFILDCQPSFRFNYTAGFEIRTPNAATSGKKPVGGMRVKQVISRPGGGGQPVVKKYRYEDATIPGNSSGVLVNFPTYGYGLQATKYNPSTVTGGCVLEGVYSYVAAQGNTNYPLATTQGSFVGYGYVIEDLGEMGEVRHTYNAFSASSAPFPFPPQESFDWMRGSEQKTEYMARKNGTLVPVKEIEYGYHNLQKAYVVGYKIGRNSINIGNCPPYYTSAPYAAYAVLPHFFALSQMKERLYDTNDASKFTETVTDYAYDPNHYQLKQIRKTTSSSTNNATNVVDEIVINKKYAKDYIFTATPSGSAAQGIKKLQDLHVINVPVEEYIYRQQRNTETQAVSNQRVISGIVTKFRTDKPYADTLYRLELTSPTALATFGTGSALNSNNSFINNSAYKAALLIPYYDERGNILQQQKPGGPPISYIYGYNKQYPVAEVKNASYQNLVTKLTQAVIDQIGGAAMSEADLRSALAPLRTIANAEASIYTYDPLVGMTSSTDARGETTYYEYDSFQRLMNVKDGNIVKHYDYHYKN